MDRQCSSCGGFCKRSGCERENVKPTRDWQGLTDEEYSQLHDGFHQQGKLLGWVVDQVETKLREKNA